MSFAFSDVQQELDGLAARVLAAHSTAERLLELDAAGTWYDDRLVRQLAELGLLGVGVPESHGGAGLGFVELAIVLVHVGAHAARVPAFESMVLGALPLARFGSPAQQARWLPGIAAGDALVTAALEEVPSGDPLRPSTTARAVDGGWELSGVRACIPAAQSAQRIIVPARVEAGGTGLFLVDPTAPGAELSPCVAHTGAPEGQLVLEQVRVADEDTLIVEPDGDDALRWLVERATAALCAIQLGAAEQALRDTARWVSERRQFGRALASFQVVGQRCADAFIVLEANRLTAWEAIWRLDQGLPAAEETSIAKWWATESAATVMETAHRLQGGVGVDMTSELPRRTLLSRHLTASLGGGRHHLQRLGAAMAAEPRDDQSHQQRSTR